MAFEFIQKFNNGDKRSDFERPKRSAGRQFQESHVRCVLLLLHMSMRHINGSFHGRVSVRSNDEIDWLKW